MRNKILAYVLDLILLYDVLSRERKQAFLENDAAFLWQVIFIEAKWIYIAD